LNGTDDQIAPRLYNNSLTSATLVDYTIKSIETSSDNNRQVCKINLTETKNSQVQGQNNTFSQDSLLVISSNDSGTKWTIERYLDKKAEGPGSGKYSGFGD